jgi:alpha-N-acetylglucosamine transferase
MSCDTNDNVLRDLQNRHYSGTTRFCNNLHQVTLKVKILEQRLAVLLYKQYQFFPFEYNLPHKFKTCLEKEKKASAINNGIE